MTFGRYLVSQLHAVVLGALLVAVVALVLGVANVSPAVVGLVCALVVVTLAAALGIGFARRRKFFGDLKLLSDRLDTARFAVEMLERPRDVEGEIAYDALARVSKTASDEVAAYRRQTEEYREYIEMWVHEAKSPLAAANLIVENISESADDARVAEIAARTRALAAELHRIEQFIDQALFYARSEALEKDYLIRSHELRGLVAAALKANSHAVIGAHMSVEMEGLDLHVLTDDKWLGFILGQLIQNSVKYARPQGACIRFAAERLQAGTAEEHIDLVVSDNGCGASPEDVPRVFDKGFTGANGRTTKRATGIGLYLVKRLCDKMGIGIRAASREGEGFSVTMSFPTNKMHYLETPPHGRDGSWA